MSDEHYKKSDVILFHLALMKAVRAFEYCYENKTPFNVLTYLLGELMTDLRLETIKPGLADF